MLPSGRKCSRNHISKFADRVRHSVCFMNRVLGNGMKKGVGQDGKDAVPRQSRGPIVVSWRCVWVTVRHHQRRWRSSGELWRIPLCQRYQYVVVNYNADCRLVYLSTGYLSHLRNELSCCNSASNEVSWVTNSTISCFRTNRVSV